MESQDKSLPAKPDESCENNFTLVIPPEGKRKKSIVISAVFADTNDTEKIEETDEFIAKQLGVMGLFENK